MVELFRSMRLSNPLEKVVRSKSNNVEIGRKDRSQSVSYEYYKTDINLINLYTIDQQRLIRTGLLIIRAMREDIARIAKDYISNMMLTKKYYTDVLVDNYFNEINLDSLHFYNKHKNEINRLEQMTMMLAKANLTEMDKNYVLHKNYLPLREDLENHFQAECEMFNSKYGININKFYSKYSYLIWQKRQQNLSDNTICKLIKTNLFRTLVIEYKDQLPTLAPYNLNFTASVKNVNDVTDFGVKIKKVGTNARKLDKILSSLTDYDCFRYQYDFGLAAGGNRSYLSKFCSSVETITKIVLDRNKNVNNIDTKRLECTNYLWQLYTSLLVAEKLCRDFAKAFDMEVRVNNDNKSVEVDPGIYFNYINDDLSNLINNNGCKPSAISVITDVSRYLTMAQNYQQCCQQIYELIELVIPLLNSLIDFNKIEYDRPNSGSANGSSSNRRRKITITEELQPLPITTTELYAKLLLIKNSYASQTKTLEQILGVNVS